MAVALRILQYTQIKNLDISTCSMHQLTPKRGKRHGYPRARHNNENRPDRHHRKEKGPALHIVLLCHQNSICKYLPNADGLLGN